MNSSVFRKRKFAATSLSPLLLGAFALLAFFTPLNTSAEEDEDASRAEDTEILTALVYGNPDDIPYGGEVPAEFPALAEALKKDFDEYPHFSLLSHHIHRAVRDLDSWVVPAKDLFIKIDANGRTEDGRGLRLHIQFWHGKKALHKTDALLSPDSPLIIPGPIWQKGRLFAVIKVK